MPRNIVISQLSETPMEQQTAEQMLAAVESGTTVRS